MDRCPKCPRINNFVPSSGPSPCRVLLVGEAPGRDEDRKKECFVGKTGMEMDKSYMPTAGLRRPQCRVTNAIRCLPISTGGKLDTNSQRDVELLDSCASTFLYQEIEDSQCEVIIPMGRFACMALDPDISLDIHHGIPRESPFGTIFPMFHPALGIHEPKKMLQLRTDWYRLGKYLRGKLKIPLDKYPDPDYQEFTTIREMIDYLDPTIPLAQDTESRRDHSAFCTTLSQYPGTGRLIRAERRDLLGKLQSYIDRWESHFIFHFWMADYGPTKSMGLSYPNKKVRDTIALAYHLGNLPQGLKALSFRELGMMMQDFNDVVTPYAIPKVIRYLQDAYSISLDWPRPDEELVRDDNGEWRPYRPQSIKTKLKRFFSDYEKNPDKDIFKAWDNWESSHEAIEQELGPWPGRCISYVPFDKTLHYACRDADATLRLERRLLGMRARVRKTAQERWGDT